MLIKFHEDFRKFTDGLPEIHIQGPTIGACLDKLFSRFPQLVVFLVNDQCEEAKRSSLLLNGQDYLWDLKDAQREAVFTDVLELGRDIPTGEGKAGMIIAGIALIALSFAIPGTWVIAKMAVKSMVFSMGLGLAFSGVGMMIAGTPKLRNDGNSDSPAYSFEGIQNSTQEGTPVSVIYGEHRVGGHYLNVYTDAQDGKNYLYAQIGLAEGEIAEISDIEINERKAEYYGLNDTVWMDYRYGVANQPAMEWFNRVENTVSLSMPALGVAGQVVSTNDECDGVKVTLKCPALYYSDPKKGLQSTEVRYKVEFRKEGTSEWISADTAYLDPNSTYSTYTAMVFAAKSKSALTNNHLIRFPSRGVYELKVTRVTPVRTGSFDYADDIYFSSYSPLTYDKFKYAHTAMLGIKILASEQLSGGLPKITSMVKGLKVAVPSNYNPITRTYSGHWDGKLSPVKQWTDNPAWCLYDLVVNDRYGMGKYLKLDKASLGKFLAQVYIMGQYCDDIMPDGEPRFRLDVVIDSVKAAHEWLGTLAAVMRSALFYTEGRINVDIDRPKQISHVFTIGNILKGTFKQSGASYKNIPNVYEVQFFDRDRRFEPRVFRLEDTDIQLDASIEERKKSLNLVGVTRLNQALRLARFALLSGKYNTKTVSFKASVESVNCIVGDIVGIQHDVPQWGYGGRVQSVNETTRTITLSNEVEIDSGKEYSVRVQHGAHRETLKVLNPPGVYTDLAMASLPLNFTIAPGDVVAVGETSFEVKPFRVISIKRETDETAELVCLEYNLDVYNTADDLKGLTNIVVRNYSDLDSPTEVSVSDVKLNERVYLGGDGTVRSGIEVTYTVPQGNSFWASAVVYYKRKDAVGGYETAPVDATGYVFIPSLEEQTEWEVVVVSKYKNGTQQPIEKAKAVGAVGSIFLRGKLAPPQDIATFTGYLDPYANNFIRFYWEPGTIEVAPGIFQVDPDLSYYEIRDVSHLTVNQGNLNEAWNSGYIVATRVKEKYYNEHYIHTSGLYKYMVKAYDSSGNASVNPKYITINAVVEPANVTGFRASQMGSEVLLTWDANKDSDLVGYEVRRGVSWDTAAVVNEMVTGTFHRVTGITSGNLRFWIKAKDKYGNLSVVAAWAEVNISNLPSQNIIQTYNEVVRGWNGNHAGTVAVGGALTLMTAYTYDAGHKWDSGLSWDDLALGVGTYETGIYDIGAVVNCNVIVEYAADLSAGNSVKIEVRTSENGIQWDEYRSFYGGYITARYVQYRLTLTSQGGALQVTSFKSHYDVPEVDYKGTATITAGSASAGVTIVFPEPYVNTPVISITLNGVVGVADVMPLSNTQFTVKIYNLSGTAIPGSFSWRSTGF